jgi:bifunctional UDP-N-acetylglucosamine pyrophosphorylase/glucosamine-1-phosphate N-acetyltransferase
MPSAPAGARDSTFPDYHQVAVKIPSVLIMAAGRGTRMRSQLPKVLHPLCGRPLILWPVEAAREAGAERVVVVVGREGDEIGRVLPPGVEVVLQDPPAGTGDAVLCASEALKDASDVIVLSGDHPLLDAGFVTALAERHSGSGAAATVTTRKLEDPGQYGRVVRGTDGGVERIVETKHPGDATAEELAIKEINAGTYAFAVGPLFEALSEVGSDNAQGEIYLGDVLPRLRQHGHKVAAFLTDDELISMGINTRADLAEVQEVARRQILKRHMLAGVTISDRSSTFIDVDVKIGEDTTVEPYCFLKGQVEIGSGCTVGPMTTLVDCVLGNGVAVMHSHLEACEVLDGCMVGPFARIRPGTKLHDRSKAGSFVEIKNSEVGAGAKVPHLSYIGDAEIGEGANIGASTITANYDGRRKHRTVIGRNVHTGIHTSLVAPVAVGDDAYTGAGSVVTDDVPDGALGIARARQTNLEGYAEREAAAEEEGKR